MELDLNVDIGEGFPFDAQLIPLVSSASIACGGHAGDGDTMARTIDQCLRHGVRIGAHPGYPDRDNFGRAPVQMAPQALLDTLYRQLDDLDRLCRQRNTLVAYVKPHGALYNQAARNLELGRLLCRAIKETVPHAALMGLSGSPLLALAQEAELEVISEAFIDRRYRDGGTLLPRSHPDALLRQPQAVKAQLTLLATEHHVEDADGLLHPIRVDSLCLHGDAPDALEHALLAHNHLRDLGFSLPRY